MIFAGAGVTRRRNKTRLTGRSGSLPSREDSGPSGGSPRAMPGALRRAIGRKTRGAIAAIHHPGRRILNSGATLRDQIAYSEHGRDDQGSNRIHGTRARRSGIESHTANTGATLGIVAIPFRFRDIVGRHTTKAVSKKERFDAIRRSTAEQIGQPLAACAIYCVSHDLTTHAFTHITCEREE
jgi:hypothetical protein